jgi:8-oxo-dGTP pyrophosphatase MutT (NUDIX family)
MIHPKPGKKGESVFIKTPHAPTSNATWGDPSQVAVVVPNGHMPDAVNGLPIGSWRDAPTDRGGWTRLSATCSIVEPPFQSKGLNTAAGAVVVEPDGRIWLVAPTNAFLNTLATFPKGTANGLDLRGAALKEVFEEAGLRIELFAHLVDVTRSSSRTRYYLARRTGGNPADMCWESQAVILAPIEALKAHLNKTYDHQVVDALIARWDERSAWFPSNDQPAQTHRKD